MFLGILLDDQSPELLAHSRSVSEAVAMIFAIVRHYCYDFFMVTPAVMMGTLLQKAGWRSVLDALHRTAFWGPSSPLKRTHGIFARDSRHTGDQRTKMGVPIVGLLTTENTFVLAQGITGLVVAL